MAGLLTARRSYAINMHCADVDVFSMLKLMEYADSQVLQRVSAQTTDDITQAHLVAFFSLDRLLRFRQLLIRLFYLTSGDR